MKNKIIVILILFYMPIFGQVEELKSDFITIFKLAENCFLEENTNILQFEKTLVGNNVHRTYPNPNILKYELYYKLDKTKERTIKKIRETGGIIKKVIPSNYVVRKGRDIKDLEPHFNLNVLSTYGDYFYYQIFHRPEDTNLKENKYPYVICIYQQSIFTKEEYGINIFFISSLKKLYKIEDELVKNGKLKREGVYDANHKRNGKWKIYDFKTKKLAEEINYTNGLRNGLYKKYTPKKVLIVDGKYINDKKEGEWKYFRKKDGSLFSLKNYKNGKKHGYGASYHESGVPYAEGKYYKGKRVGKWLYRDKNNKLTEVEKFQHFELDFIRVFEACNNNFYTSNTTEMDAIGVLKGYKKPIKIKNPNTVLFVKDSTYKGKKDDLIANMLNTSFLDMTAALPENYIKKKSKVITELPLFLKSKYLSEEKNLKKYYSFEIYHHKVEIDLEKNKHPIVLRLLKIGKIHTEKVFFISPQEKQKQNEQKNIKNVEDKSVWKAQEQKRIAVLESDYNENPENIGKALNYTLLNISKSGIKSKFTSLKGKELKKDMYQPNEDFPYTIDSYITSDEKKNTFTTKYYKTAKAIFNKLKKIEEVCITGSTQSIFSKNDTIEIIIPKSYKVKKNKIELLIMYRKELLFLDSNYDSKANKLTLSIAVDEERTEKMRAIYFEDKFGVEYSDSDEIKRSKIVTFGAAETYINKLTSFELEENVFVKDHYGKYVYNNQKVMQVILILIKKKVDGKYLPITKYPKATLTYRNNDDRSVYLNSSLYKRKTFSITDDKSPVAFVKYILFADTSVYGIEIKEANNSRVLFMIRKR